MQRRSSPIHDDLSAENIIKEEVIIEEKVCSISENFEIYLYYSLYYSYKVFRIANQCIFLADIL